MLAKFNPIPPQQCLSDVLNRDMGIVCHPLGPNNNRSIDVYPLQFILSDYFRLETRTCFPVMKERVRKLG